MTRGRSAQTGAEGPSDVSEAGRRVGASEGDVMASRLPSRDVVKSMATAVMSVQQGTVRGHIERVHRARPDASPAEILDRLEKLYLSTVSASGGAVGAVAALPAVGTGAALAVSGLEFVGFMEATALYTLAVAEV